PHLDSLQGRATVHVQADRAQGARLPRAESGPAAWRPSGGRLHGAGHRERLGWLRPRRGEAQPGQVQSTNPRTQLSNPPPNMTPIQTEYRDCHFRSRLEARWAVLFDAMGLAWEYELEGFDLPSG